MPPDACYYGNYGIISNSIRDLYNYLPCLLIMAALVNLADLYRTVCRYSRRTPITPFSDRRIDSNCDINGDSSSHSSPSSYVPLGGVGRLAVEMPLTYNGLIDGGSVADG